MVNQEIVPPMLSPEKLADVQRQARESFPALSSLDDLDRKALFYKALGDSTRLKIVSLLLVSDVCLCQLVELLQIPTSTMTHHLQVLDRGGVITTERAGKFTKYAIRDMHRHALAQALRPTTK